ncbi:hypothetical protein, partial [Faecalibaculum rodentium]|uniref:hypothetical protein n=1 Tax=Faecalibaculum rodentium TaxID=1702221 RepID=UPI0026773A3B
LALFVRDKPLTELGSLSSKRKLQCIFSIETFCIFLLEYTLIFMKQTFQRSVFGHIFSSAFHTTKIVKKRIKYSV